MWLFYVVLLICVEFHGVIGLYRLCVKWGWFEGKDAKITRRRLKIIARCLIAFFIVLGLLNISTFIKIGLAL